MASQHLDVCDRFAAVGEHHRDVDQHPATVMDLGEMTADSTPPTTHL